MLDHFIRSYAANEQVIYLRLRRRPPAAGAAAGAGAGAAGDPNNPDEGAFSGMVGGEGNALLSLPNQPLDSGCLGCSAGCCSSGLLEPIPNQLSTPPPRLLLVLLDLERDLHLDLDLRDFDLDL